MNSIVCYLKYFPKTATPVSLFSLQFLLLVDVRLDVEIGKQDKVKAAMAKNYPAVNLK